MSPIRRSEFIVSAALIAIFLGVLGGTARADFNTPLVQCITPSMVHLTSNCASPSDPLTRGEVRIGDEGGVTISVVGGGSGLSYSADFRSLDGTKSAHIGTVALDQNGNKSVFIAQLFKPLKTAGAGIVVLSRNGQDEYVSAINIAGNPGSPDTRADFVECGMVSVPEAFANCGTDPLKNGNLYIDGDDGTLEVTLHGAEAMATYNAVLMQVTGSPITLGSFTTDKHGNFVLQKSGAIAPGTIETGVVVVQNSTGTLNEFVGGFDVTETPPPPTLSKSSLVPCAMVNDPSLADCGTDPLTQGQVQINDRGVVNASLNGAEPMAIYEVFYRPLDNGSDQDTGLKLTADANGNASGSVQFIESGKSTIGSGSFVVKGGGFDEFVPAFEVP